MTAAGELIRFDRPARICFGVLVALLGVFTAFKVHGSSVGLWNKAVPNAQASLGVMLGHPRAIRSDEWAVETPAMVSQAMSRPAFPRVNLAWATAQAPLLFNLPTAHWSMLLRPQYAGFFLFDLERGFAFYWNMKAFVLLGGTFLLLMLLTGSDVWISLLGSAWIFFSGFIQWWYSTPGMLPEGLGYLALLLVAAHYLALSAGRLAIAVSAVAFALGALNFAWLFYPAFQVPLFYLGLAVLAGSLGPRLSRGDFRSNLRFRLACAAAALVAVGCGLVVYYVDARQAIDLMRSTAYPGSRVGTGGDVTLAQLFNGLYGLLMTEQTFPRIWGNVCEASNFLLLFPLPAAVIVRRAWRREPVGMLLWSLLAYLALVSSWMLIGGPRFLAVVTGFGLSHTTRWLVGLGPASIFLCCLFLAERRDDAPARWSRRCAIAALIAAMVLVYSWIFNHATESFAKPLHVAGVTLLVTAAAYALLMRHRAWFALCVLAPTVIVGSQVNPVATGLAPILESRPFRAVHQIVDQDPTARWISYGSNVRANLLKAAGARVFNGTNILPPLDDLRVLDPDGSDILTYNRYAHMSLAPIGGPTVTFTLNQPDRYTLSIDPRNELWRRLGIRYVALPGATMNPTFLSIATLVAELPKEEMWIYRYRW